MPSNAHLDKGRRKEVFVIPVHDPDGLAIRGCRRRGMSGADIASFMYVFRVVRNEINKGRDPQPLLYRFEAAEQHLAVAAYTEAVASTRAPGWAE